MKPLSISVAWNETVAFVKRESGLLFPVALALLAVPSIVVQYFMPASTPGVQPEPGPWMWLFIPLIFFTLLGSLTITALALRPAQSVQEAIGHAMRRLLPALGAALLLLLASLLIVIPVVVVIALAGFNENVASMLTVLAFLAVFTFFWIRFILLNPVAVSEPVGPLAILKRSWHLTSGHFSKLVGFVTILAVVAAVVLVAVSLLFATIIALLAGPPEPGNLSFVLSTIISGVISAIFSVYLNVLIARIYAQLGEGAPISGT